MLNVIPIITNLDDKYQCTLLLLTVLYFCQTFENWSRTVSGDKPTTTGSGFSCTTDMDASQLSSSTRNGSSNGCCAGASCPESKDPSYVFNTAGLDGTTGTGCRTLVSATKCSNNLSTAGGSGTGAGTDVGAAALANSRRNRISIWSGVDCGVATAATRRSSTPLSDSLTM